MSVAALRKGRERMMLARRREAVRRVRAFRTWKRHRFDRAHRPETLPTDTDFRLARAAGVE